MSLIRLGFAGLLAMTVTVGCGGDGPSGGTAGNAGTGGTAGTGATDGGVDAGLACDQLPAPGGELGGQCRGEAFECNGDLICLAEQTLEVGGSSDPIRDYPPGANAPQQIRRPAFSNAAFAYRLFPTPTSASELVAPKRTATAPVATATCAIFCLKFATAAAPRTTNAVFFARTRTGTARSIPGIP